MNLSAYEALKIMGMVIAVIGPFFKELIRKKDASPLISLTDKPDWQNQTLPIENAYYLIFKKHCPASLIIFAMTRKDGARRALDDLVLAYSQVEIKNGDIVLKNKKLKYLFGVGVPECVRDAAFVIMSILYLFAISIIFVIYLESSLILFAWPAAFLWSLVVANHMDTKDATKRLLALNTTHSNQKRKLK